MKEIAVLCIDKADFEEALKVRFEGFKLTYSNNNWYIDDMLVYPLYPRGIARDNTISFVESKKVQGIIDKYLAFMNDKAKRSKAIGKHEKSFVEQETEMW